MVNHLKITRILIVIWVLLLIAQTINLINNPSVYGGFATGFIFGCFSYTFLNYPLEKSTHRLFESYRTLVKKLFRHIEFLMIENTKLEDAVKKRSRKKERRKK